MRSDVQLQFEMRLESKVYPSLFYQILVLETHPELFLSYSSVSGSWATMCSQLQIDSIASLVAAIYSPG